MLWSEPFRNRAGLRESKHRNDRSRVEWQQSHGGAEQDSIWRDAENGMPASRLGVPSAPPASPPPPLRRPPPPPRAYLGCLRNRWLPRATPLAAQLRMRPRKKQYRKPLLGESIGESIHRDIIRESIHPVRRGALGIAHELARAAASDDTIRRGAPLLRVL